MHQDQQPTTVYLVDAHDAQRQAWQTHLDAVDDIRVVGESESAVRSLGEVRDLRPRVVILNLQLPDGTAAAACRLMLSDSPALYILIVTASENSRAISDAMRAGARGCLPPNADPEALVGAVRRVATGAFS